MNQLDLGGEALRSARAHVHRQQHSGAHEQDRADARAWMDAYAGGRCSCDRCVRDEKVSSSRSAVARISDGGT